MLPKARAAERGPCGAGEGRGGVRTLKLRGEPCYPPPRYRAAAGKFGQLGYPWLDYFRAAAGISGWGLVGEVKLAVLLLGFATGVSWRGEIGRVAAAETIHEGLFRPS